MKTKHRMLSVLTVLALVASVSTVMVAPAGAAEATLILTPNIGPAETVVTVTGTGFPENAQGTLTAAGVIEDVSFTTTADGKIPPGITATILADAPLGEQTLTATVDGVTASATFTVTFPLTLSPVSGLPGTRVTVTGVVPDIDAPAPGILTATPAGVIAPEHFMTGGRGEIALIVEILAGAPVGEATFIATVGLDKGSATFTVKAPPAAITLAPRSGLPGTEVTVTGVRFPPNAPGVLSAPGVISPVTFMTTADGAIPATTVTILPGAPAGAHTLTATVGEISDTATFTVIAVPVPIITLDPVEGPRGTEVTVTGTDFPANAPGIITAPGVIAPETFETDRYGAFSQAVTILGGAPFGLATITATVGVVSDDALFTVTPPPAPTITLSPPAGARRTVVTVTGANFAPGTKGVIMAPGVIAPIGFTTQGVGDPNPGSFSTTVAILGGAPFGAATFTVTVGVVSATDTFTVQAPSITLTPIGGVRGAQVTVEGEGFPPGTAGTITSPGVIDPVGFEKTTPAGKIPATIATILLDAPLGPATFTATVDPPGPPPAVTAEATYTVGITPTITLSPTIGFEGTEVTVTGFGFPVETAGTITAPGVIKPVTFETTAAGTFSTTVTIQVGAPVGSATITATVGDLSATAQFVVAGPGVPVIVPEPVVPVLEGLEGIWDRLGEAIWHFRDGRWFRFHTDPAIHAEIPEDERLTELVSGEAYWIYLTEDVTDELIGGVRRTLRAGWHNIGWVL
ncbi:hypothetical protein M1N84_01260 [Dehalococcoidia bacterium]|nr:hypothetical protein [Dehalococcoidia bacterium]